MYSRVTFVMHVTGKQKQPKKAQKVRQATRFPTQLCIKAGSSVLHPKALSDVGMQEISSSTLHTKD